MHRAGRRASKVNGCEKIGSSPAPCSKNGEKKIGPLSPIRPKGSERKPGAADCPAAWPSVLRYAPRHAQGARWGARLPRSVRSPQTKKRRSSERRNKDWSGQRGSNPRPPPWQGGALPTEPCPRIWRREQIRTGGEGFAGPCLTTWPSRHYQKKPARKRASNELERTTGLEPATPTLARWCSTN